MNKKIIFVLMLFALLPLVLAQSAPKCNMDAVLLNQDPYPAVPGDYVKVVLQVTGVADKTCGDVSVTFVEDFPFSVDAGQKQTYNFKSGLYTSNNYPSFFLAPFQLRVANDALDGDNRIKFLISSVTKTLEKNFTINIESLEADFEVSINEYDPSTNTLTFEILNIGENDIEALTVEIPKQSNIDVKGSNRNIVGDLDANEDTTFSFEAIPKDGSIDLVILYTDQVNVRRTLEKSVDFDSSYFTGRAGDSGGVSPWVWIILVIIIVVVFLWFRSRRKKKQKHRS